MQPRTLVSVGTEDGRLLILRASIVEWPVGRCHNTLVLAKRCLRTTLLQPWVISAAKCSSPHHLVPCGRSAQVSRSAGASATTCVSAQLLPQACALLLQRAMRVAEIPPACCLSHGAQHGGGYA